MHTTIWTRSAISIASLAIGSVVLAAAPASADTTPGMTRENVLNIAANARIGFSSSQSLDASTRTRIEKICGFDASQQATIRLEPTYNDDGVDGFLARTFIEGTDEISSQSCTFAAFATAEPFSSMTGTATISVVQNVLNLGPAAAPATDQDYILSGDVYVTKPRTDISSDDNTVVNASGDVTRTVAARTTTSRVVTPKTTAVKVAARKTYHRAIDKAQAKLAKALAKAGDSRGKKASARKAYAARKKAAKARLHIAWSGDKKTVVTTVPTSSTTNPFVFTTADRR